MNPSMRQSLRKLGWGLLLIILDINIGYFDILPDFIGYMLILISLNQLDTGKISFKQARWLATILFFISLPQLIFKASIDINQLTDLGLGFHAYSQGLLILHGLMSYYIVQGLYKIAKPIATAELSESLVSRLRIYMGLLAMQLISYPFLLNFGEELWVLAFLIGIAMFIMELLLMRIPFRISNIINVPSDQLPTENAPIQ